MGRCLRERGKLGVDGAERGQEALDIFDTEIALFAAEHQVSLTGHPKQVQRRKG
jgi:hypothetical protein